MLHRAAYQHKTVKKIELHMIDILDMIDKDVRITGEGGQKMRISEAAAALDPVAYPKLTDTFVEARLLDKEDPALAGAAAEYERRIVRRQLMRLVGDWDLPRQGEVGVGSSGPLPLPKPEDVIAAVHERYTQCAAELEPEQPVRGVLESELRCQVATFHYGMGSRDPITRVLFHSSKSEQPRGFQVDTDARPLRQKVFVFWNPSDKPSDAHTLRRLTLAFNRWAERQVELHTASVAASPCSSPSRGTVPPRATSPLVRKPLAAPRDRPRRALKIQASCPVTM
mmetsp:Transcript_76801/g.238452  ORF Transcript_76801/g.238452 Transcript_76801/m.238452 type:complete len:282 (+) Transcript_76801:3-848(+)